MLIQLKNIQWKLLRRGNPLVCVWQFWSHAFGIMAVATIFLEPEVTTFGEDSGALEGILQPIQTIHKC